MFGLWCIEKMNFKFELVRRIRELCTTILILQSAARNKAKVGEGLGTI